MEKLDLVGICTLTLLFSACASQPIQNKDSARANQAPASMTPPDYDEKTPVIDDLHMRSQADYHFTVGEALSLEGKHQRAVEEFKLTLVYDNKSPQVRTRLAKEYMRMGQTAEAMEQAESAVEQNPKSIEAHSVLGNIYSNLKLFDKAAIQYRAVLQLDAQNLEAPVFLAAILAEQKKFDESIDMFQKISERKDNPNRQQAAYFIGRIYVERGQEYWGHAEKAFARAIELKPGWVEPVSALAQLYRAELKTDEMVKLLVSFQDKFGPSVEIARDLGDYYLEKDNFDAALEQLEIIEAVERENLNIKVKIALILIEKKQYETAAQRLKDVLREVPESDKIRFYLAAVQEELQQVDDAVANYQMVPASSTYFPDAVIHAAFLMKQKSSSEARALVEKALSQRKDMASLYVFYAALLDEAKDYQSAFNMLTPAVQQFPEHAHLRFYYGTILDHLGQSEKSIAEMNQVLQLDSNHVQALNFLAYTYAEKGLKLVEAEDLARRALKLQPSDGFILDTMGWVLFKQGRYQESLHFLESAFRERSKESVIAEHLGDVYYRLQLPEKAKSMYSRALENERDEKKVREIRDKMVSIDHQQETPLRTPAAVLFPE